MNQPHWPDLTAETVRHLQTLIRFNTSNPPGNETLAADYLAGVLTAEGLEPIVLESAPGRGNVIARLKGAGAQPPLLLYGHTDVVPAEPEDWLHPPFGGEIADGYVWGRGAVDMKGAVAQQLVVFLLLKRLNLPLQRDVIFAATADEEIGGVDGYGVSWLVKHHPDLLRAEFGLTELGGYTLDFAGKVVYPIQVAEKGAVWLKLKTTGRPGHGSVPHPDNAVVKLARALDRLATQGLPYHLTDTTLGFLDTMSGILGGELGAVMAQLKSPERAPQLLEGPLLNHPLQPFLNAMVRNTATPTGLSAGYKTNVIPGDAEAVIDGRTLPGFDTEAFLEEVHTVVGPNFQSELILTSPPLQTRTDTPLFELMARTLKAHDPRANVVPYMMSGATDAKYLAPLGVPSYGFMPMKLPPGLDFMGMFHAHNERAPIDGLGWGVQVLFDVVRAYAAAG